MMDHIFKIIFSWLFNQKNKWLLDPKGKLEQVIVLEVTLQFPNRIVSPKVRCIIPAR
jgi:hypothetical protein